jgi:hypothetical protein
MMDPTRRDRFPHRFRARFEEDLRSPNPKGGAGSPAGPFLASYGLPAPHGAGPYTSADPTLRP